VACAWNRERVSVCLEVRVDMCRTDEKDRKMRMATGGRDVGPWEDLVLRAQGNLWDIGCRCAGAGPPVEGRGAETRTSSRRALAGVGGEQAPTRGARWS
jgi:hypothetical protein